MPRFSSVASGGHHTAPFHVKTSLLIKQSCSIIEFLTSRNKIMCRPSMSDSFIGFEEMETGKCMELLDRIRHILQQNVIAVSQCTLSLSLEEYRMEFGGIG